MVSAREARQLAGQPGVGGVVEAEEPVQYDELEGPPSPMFDAFVRERGVDDPVPVRQGKVSVKANTGKRKSVETPSGGPMSKFTHE